MKRFVLWLIRLFRLDIPVEVVKTVEKERVVCLPKDGVVDGDVTINGDLLVTGKMTVSGGLTIYSGKEAGNGSV